MPEERRRHERKGVYLEGAFQLSGGERIPAQLTDLSLGGAFFETEQVPAFGAQLTLIVTLPDSERETEIKATVRWCQDHGVGVQFGLLRARDTYALTEFLATVE